MPVLMVTANVLCCCSSAGVARNSASVAWLKEPLVLRVHYLVGCDGGFFFLLFSSY